MIDCGEGAQLQLRRSRLRFTRLNHIFISHLHGDHCFGLPGLVSTFGMLGRTATLHVYAPHGAEAVFRPLLDFFCARLPYEVVFHEFDTQEASVIYSDRSLTVETIPLRHRIPCSGFLFAEKSGQRHINRGMTDFYRIPISEYNRLKNGADYTTPDGDVIANARLTTPPTPVRHYAYCSDTAYNEAMIPQLAGVDLLFHEATFAEADLPRAGETFHSTARQAAQIALSAKAKRLVIGHFSARYEDESILLNEAAEVFPAVCLAKENLRVSL
jgi:ribonuclease Z